MTRPFVIPALLHTLWLDGTWFAYRWRSNASAVGVMTLADQLEADNPLE